jgi:hypothetical protein
MKFPMVNTAAAPLFFWLVWAMTMLSSCVADDSNSMLFWVPGGNFYRISAVYYATWEDARTAARASEQCGVSGDLAAITSAEEQDEIARNYLYFRYSVGHLWIGLSFNDTVFDWQWVDGTVLTGSFQTWATGEPNSDEEDCAEITGDQGFWNNDNCYVRKNLLAEYQKPADCPVYDWDNCFCGTPTEAPIQPPTQSVRPSLGAFAKRRISQGPRHLKEINARHLVESNVDCAREDYDMYFVAPDSAHFAGLAVPKDASKNCPSLVFHAQVDENSKLQKTSVQVNEDDVAELQDEDMLYLGSKPLVDIVKAYETAPVGRKGVLYDAISNNCVVLLRNMADPLEIPVDARLIGFATKKLTDRTARHLVEMMKASPSLQALYEGSRRVLKSVSTEDLIAKVIQLYV